MDRLINLVVIRPRETQLLLFTTSILFTYITTLSTAQELLQAGFKATPNPKISTFQPLLNDSTGNFSLAFLRVNKTQLALAVLHVPSSEPLWLANPTDLASWSDHTQLFFNGSLMISDPHSRVFWSTPTNGDLVVLLNSSNLQVQKKLDQDSSSVLWQSFDFPTDTLVENQNFTATQSLISQNGLCSMRLGSNFIGLYANFQENYDQIYWKHTALEAKAAIVEGQGPIYVRVNSDGYLGMYQNGTTPVDVEPFRSFQRSINGFLRLRLEPDGDLKGYYWDGSSWILNYQAISDTCELPSPCGPYGLCMPGSGCSCLDNRTEFRSGVDCAPVETGNFCGEKVVKDNFKALTRSGVELPYKQLMQYETTSSLEQCEGLCENNCSCWGVVYNNASGFCYVLDYPIQTLVAVGDESKVGYFKVREGAGKRKRNAGVVFAYAVVGGVIVVLIGIIGFWTYRTWWRRKRNQEEEGDFSPGPYKNLGSASFKSIEMSSR
ncbi:PAN domain-containing protein At5g03700 [Alnus glutinosa]|uniref:PAN domain-containing protein At5g03700 n=1 Tax=Alnus glutinosa TaxID=3517 RepID=UPI002D771168|nr:PAN domain-containing protein At5g03700 [Alnus glutinosa]